MSECILDDTPVSPQTRILLPLAVVVLAENQVLGSDVAVLHQLLHAGLQQILERIVLPIAEPNLHTMIDLLLIGVGLINDARSSDVVAIVKSLANEAQDNRLPEGGKLLVIVLYHSFPKQTNTQEHDSHVTSVHVLFVFVLGFNTLLEDALALDLGVTSSREGFYAILLGRDFRVLGIRPNDELLVAIIEHVTTE